MSLLKSATKILPTSTRLYATKQSGGKIDPVQAEFLKQFKRFRSRFEEMKKKPQTLAAEEKKAIQQELNTISKKDGLEFLNPKAPEKLTTR